jgi:formylglycine-generating enzyme required for sulfatase activity
LTRNHLILKCAPFLLVVIVPLVALGQTAQKKAKFGMSLIPAGTFEMGQRVEDIPKLMEFFKVKHVEIFQEETPQHRVKLSAFYLDKHEVTNAQFQAFVKRNPDWQKDRLSLERQNGKYLADWNGNEPPSGKADFPVVFVTWHAAVAFCRDQGKRLPTEAEWEWAARGGLSNKMFPWGDEMPDKSRANYGASGFDAAIAVGKYPPNGYGLFDMSGNVWEFLADEWAKYPATGELLVNPIAGGEQLSGSGYLKVTTRRSIRGGSYGAGVLNLRVTYRDSHQPLNAGDHVGFRCAKNL